MSTEEDRKFARIARSILGAYCDIPEDLGDLLAVRGRASSELPIVIHLQEAHGNKVSQRNVASIINKLVEQLEIDLVFVEGRTGSVGSEWLLYRHLFSNLDDRKNNASVMLDQGRISGSEYAYIVSERVITLWGIEHSLYYETNLKMDKESKQFNDYSVKLIDGLRKSLVHLTDMYVERGLISEEFDGLMAKSNDYRRDTIKLTDYLEALAQIVERYGISTRRYPNYAQLLAQIRIGVRMNSDRVMEDARAIYRQLSSDKELPQFKELPQLRRLASKARARGGRYTREYYEHLESILHKHNKDLRDFQNLGTYLNSLRHRRDMQMDSVTAELVELQWHLLATLADTSEGKMIVSIGKNLDVVESFLKLRLAAYDYRTLPASYWANEITKSINFLQTALAEHGLPDFVTPSLDNFETHLSLCEKYYDLAYERGTILAKNACEKLLETKEDIAILVAGGFHTPRIIRYLRDKGFAVVTLTPKVS